MAIDVHTHFTPRHFPSASGRNARWPAMETNAAGEFALTIGGKMFRKLEASSFDARARLRDMAEDGVDRQVVSPMPELLSYWFPAHEADDFATHVNHALAELCADPAFVGLGMVPLQDPALAARRLSEVKALGFCGVEIGTHVDGVPLGDARFHDVYAEAERLGLCLFVHPLHPAGLDRMAGAPPLGAVAGFPLETALAAVALMTHGVVERFPNLRILLSHGGGALPWILPRLSATRRLDPALSSLFASEPYEMAQTFFYDSIVYEEAALRFLVDRVGRRAIVAGSDYPYSIRQPQPSRFAAQALGISEAELDAHARHWLFGRDAR